MKKFKQRQFRKAIAYAEKGKQALHLHRMLTPWAPACFKREIARGNEIAHLFDNNKKRLIRTAKKLGVKIVIVERESECSQHIDLCGNPLRKALDMCAKVPESIWFEEYRHCACSFVALASRDLPGYCPRHGNGRKIRRKLPAGKNFKKSDLGYVPM